MNTNCPRGTWRINFIKENNGFNLPKGGEKCELWRYWEVTIINTLLTRNLEKANITPLNVFTTVCILFGVE